MSVTNAEIDLEAVAAVVREVADTEAMPRWRNLAAGDIVEKNGPDDLVTVADRAVEAVLSRRLADLLPGSAVVGEEAVHADPALIERLRAPGRIWVIDPIDGTSNFAKGDPGFALMVALVEDGVPVAGWLHAPAMGHTTFAAKGQGVWYASGAQTPVRMTKPPAVSSLADLAGMVGKRAFTPERRTEILAKAPRFKSLTPNTGCAGLDYPLLATGRCDFVLYGKTEPWDHLPGLAIVTELGFHYARLDRSRYSPGDNTGGLLVTAEPAMWEEVRAALMD